MDFTSCKNILIIRPDNMGDVLMSVPAMRAIKTSFGCKITILCSTAAAAIAELIVEVDQTMVFDLPWLKHELAGNDNETLSLVEKLRAQHFDGCVLFNVYSQNPAPAIVLSYLAGIPLRAAFSRENLYGLLTHWLPDDEPYHIIRHQVERDLKLAYFIGAKKTNRTEISIRNQPSVYTRLLNENRLRFISYFVLNVGVSESKRRYPKHKWMALVKMLAEQYDAKLVFTGAKAEEAVVAEIAATTGEKAINLAGKTNLVELIDVIKNARAIITVNSGPMHLAAATGTPIIALYAQSNPQHTPWQCPHQCLFFSVADDLKSKNTVIKFVDSQYYQTHVPLPEPSIIIKTLNKLLAKANVPTSSF